MAFKDQVHRRGHTVVDTSDLLRKAGLKVTKARLAILDILAQEHGPFTTDELYTRLSTPHSESPCDIVTIYRCLAKFESLGLINRCDFGDNSIRFELSTKDRHHHHIICRECKRIEPLPKCPVEDRTIKTPEMGFKEVSHRLEFFGICPDCYRD